MSDYTQLSITIKPLQLPCECCTHYEILVNGQPRIVTVTLSNAREIIKEFLEGETK